MLLASQSRTNRLLRDLGNWYFDEANHQIIRIPINVTSISVLEVEFGVNRTRSGWNRNYATEEIESCSTCSLGGGRGWSR